MPHLETFDEACLPLEFIFNTIKYCDRPTLVTCLRVNKRFFEKAGKLLYRRIHLRDASHEETFTYCVLPPLVEQARGHTFKDQLLAHVERLD